jgi:hypothetical protein
MLRSIGLGAGALALAPSGALAAPLASETPRLRDGHVEVVDVAAGSGLDAGGRAARGARAMGLVDAPFSVTMRAVVAFERYASTFAPLVMRARVLARAHGRARVYLEFALPEPVGEAWCDLDARIDGAPSGEHTVALTRRDGSLAALHLRLSLAPTPGRVRTIVALTVLADPGVTPLGAGALPGIHRDLARTAFGALRRGVRARLFNALPSR